jgi:tetrahydromethanopterin S-methyltransferase subunit A
MQRSTPAPQPRSTTVSPGMIRPRQSGFPTVEVIDLIGASEIEPITATVRGCAERNPGPGEPFAPNSVLVPIAGRVPEKMISDPAGYFVIFIDRRRGLLNLEHYRNNGV